MASLSESKLRHGRLKQYKSRTTYFIIFTDREGVFKENFFQFVFSIFYFLSSKRERERNQILVFQILLRAESGGVLRKRDG